MKLREIALILALAVTAFADGKATADEGLDDTASVALEDNPLIGDPATPSMIKHHSTAPTATGVSSPPASDSFTVKTWRIIPQKKITAPVQLISPNHDSKLTPGVVRFVWKLNAKPKNKKKIVMEFVLEKLDAGKRAVQPTTLEKLNIDLKTGSYRWQITNEKYHIASHWRYFKVENPYELRSKSLGELYQGSSPAGGGASRAAPVAKLAAKPLTHPRSKSTVRIQPPPLPKKYEAQRAESPGQPAPASVTNSAPAAQPVPAAAIPAPAGQYQDTDERALAQDAGVPGAAPRVQPQASVKKAKRPVKTVQQPPPQLRQPAKAPVKPPVKTLVQQPAAPKSEVPKPLPVEPVAAKAKPASAPSRVPASQAPADERQRDLDTLKFDE